MRIIFRVLGINTVPYEGSREWTVCAYTRKAEAEAHAERCRSALKKHLDFYRRRHDLIDQRESEGKITDEQAIERRSKLYDQQRKWRNPHDPECCSGNASADEDTSYAVEEVKLVGPE